MFTQGPQTVLLVRRCFFSSSLCCFMRRKHSRLIEFWGRFVFVLILCGVRVEPFRWFAAEKENIFQFDSQRRLRWLMRYLWPLRLHAGSGQMFTFDVTPQTLQRRNAISKKFLILFVYCVPVDTVGVGQRLICLQSFPPLPSSSFLSAIGRDKKAI